MSSRLDPEFFKEINSSNYSRAMRLIKMKSLDPLLNDNERSILNIMKCELTKEEYIRKEEAYKELVKALKEFLKDMNEDK